MSVHYIFALVEVAADAALRSMPFTQAIIGASLGIGRGMMTGLLRCNPPFCAYGAVASVMTLKAYIAMREEKPQHAEDHALHALAAAILAFVHLLG